MAYVCCWFETTFTMRAGRSGWLTPGSASLQYAPNKQLELSAMMDGTTMRNSIKTIPAKDVKPLPRSPHDYTHVVPIHTGDVDDPHEANVVVAVEVDNSYIPDFPRAEFDRAVGIAAKELLRKYPDTAMWVKPAD